MKNSKIYDEETLTKTSLEIKERSELLLNEARFTYDLILNLMDKYPDNSIELLPWDEQERVLKQCETLVGRLKILNNDLKKLDSDYNDICKKVNSHYNKEVMPQLNIEPINFNNLMEDE